MKKYNEGFAHLGFVVLLIVIIVAVIFVFLGDSEKHTFESISLNRDISQLEKFTDDVLIYSYQYPVEWIIRSCKKGNQISCFTTIPPEMEEGFSVIENPRDTDLFADQEKLGLDCNFDSIKVINAIRWEKTICSSPTNSSDIVTYSSQHGSYLYSFSELSPENPEYAMVNEMITSVILYRQD